MCIPWYCTEKVATKLHHFPEKGTHWKSVDPGMRKQFTLLTLYVKDHDCIWWKPDFEKSDHKTVSGLSHPQPWHETSLGGRVSVQAWILCPWECQFNWHFLTTWIKSRNARETVYWLASDIKHLSASWPIARFMVYSIDHETMHKMLCPSIERYVDQS